MYRNETSVSSGLKDMILILFCKEKKVKKENYDGLFKKLSSTRILSFQKIMIVQRKSIEENQCF